MRRWVPPRLVAGALPLPSRRGKRPAPALARPAVRLLPVPRPLHWHRHPSAAPPREAPRQAEAPGAALAVVLGVWWCQLRPANGASQSSTGSSRRDHPRQKSLGVTGSRFLRGARGPLGCADLVALAAPAFTQAGKPSVDHLPSAAVPRSETRPIPKSLMAGTSTAGVQLLPALSSAAQLATPARCTASRAWSPLVSAPTHRRRLGSQAKHGEELSRRRGVSTTRVTNLALSSRRGRRAGGDDAMLLHLAKLAAPSTVSAQAPWA